MIRTACFALAGAAIALGAPLAAAQNLVTNPGFDDLDHDFFYGDSWGVFGAAGFDDFFPNGNPGHVIFYGDMTGNFGGIYQLGIPANAGAEYQFSIDVSWEADWDARTQMGIEFYAADDSTKLGERIVDVTETGLGNGYSRIAVAAVAPAGTVYARPVVLFDNVESAGADHGCTLDNAALIEVAPSGNLTANPGFLDLNSDFDFGDGWLTYGNAGYADWFPNGNAGHAVLYGDSIFNSGGLFQLDIPAIEGVEYQFCADMQFEVNWDALCEMGLEFYASDDATKLGEAFIELTDGPPAQLGYHRQMVTATAPAGTVYVRPVVRFDFVSSDGVSRAATIDNATITEADGNLVKNPGFDDWIGDGTFGDLWYTYGNAGFADFFGNGSPGHAVLYADTIGNYGGIFQVGIPAAAGETYQFSIDLQVEGDWDADLHLAIEFYEADDATQLDAVSQLVSPTPGAGYATFSVTATAPAGAAIVRPLVQFDNVLSEGPSHAATADNAVLSVGAACPCDIDGNGTLNLDDVNQFAAAFIGGSLDADVDGNGTLNLDDVNVFASCFLSGCP
ncbi:MAG: GC-type dockerin domain-anchored protein [Phycisphaerales bacterium]